MTETAGQRLTRVLALVPWLSAHNGVTLTEAAGHFGVTEAQLEADLWMVILCGVPGYMPDQLIDIDFWDDGRIHVIEPLMLTRPLRLSHEEGLTLLVALRLLGQTPGLAGHTAISSASAKLERAVEAQGIGRSIAVDVDVSPDVSEVIADLGSTAVRIVYASGTDDTVSERLVEPHRVFNVDGIAYLDAYCHRAGALRTFRLDRIVSAERTDLAFSGGPGVQEQSPSPPAQAVEAVLELAPSARWILDVHGATLVSRDPFLVKLQAHSSAWVVRLVLSQGGAAIVHEPQSLRMSVLEAARKARGAYPGA